MEYKENKSDKGGRLKEVDVVGGPTEMVYGECGKSGSMSDKSKIESQMPNYPKD